MHLVMPFRIKHRLLRHIFNAAKSNTFGSMNGVFFLRIVCLLVSLCWHAHGFRYSIGEDFLNTGKSWLYLTRFCFSAKPDSALSQLKPQINISLRIRVYPGAAILLNWEDKRAQSACKRANCQQDVTWNNYVKDTTSCTDRRLITATSGDMIELPELDHVYRFGDDTRKPEEEGLLAYKFNTWTIKCLKDPNVKLGNRCKDDIATFETSLNYVDNKERWYFFSIGSCRESSDYPLILREMTIDIRNYGSSSAERLLSADTYYLPGLMWGKGAFAIVGTIAGSILLHVFLEMGRLHYTLLLPILMIYVDDFAVLFFLATANPESKFQALDDEQSDLLFVYRILQCISNALLLLNTLLVVAGWIVTKNKLKASTRIAIAGAVTLYLVLQIFNVVADFATYNRGVITYRFENSFGIMVLIYRSILSLFVCAQGIYSIRKYRSQKYLCATIAFISTCWLNAIPILKLLMVMEAIFVPMCAIQGVIDWVEFVSDQFCTILFIFLWTPIKYNLKRIRRFNSVSKAHQTLLSVCVKCDMSTSGSNKRETIVYRRTEKRLFMSRTLRILDTFDTKLKSVIGENAEINDLLGYTETQQKNITSHTDDDDAEFYHDEEEWTEKKLE